ncbi:MAG: SGNH/GDSL hydrolase family protein [Niabella sp.]|nr:SGNH/GDSL hydrolase family protein [Niabella sp.]
MLSLVMLAAFICRAQTITIEKDTTWKKFRKHSFTINGFDAWYVSPLKPAAGNPWVWRAYFPDWHTDMDSILLERGFYIAYVKAPDRFGHYTAMNIWDDLYKYLTAQKQFATKPALEAVSRGGLYAYAWAKRNPSKVSCIYAEAPVCDFTSWPGGRGKGKGSKADWEKLLKVFGLTEAQALEYKDQPKDNLETLAAYKVPILHVIGLKDSIVPYAENTALLVQNYINAGGPAAVVPMTRGAQELNGHHFTIEQPEKLADFIYANCVPVKVALPEERFIQSFGSLNNVLDRIRKKQTVTVAFLGGSITNMTGWRDRVCTWLAQCYPAVHFNFINAGIPSLGSLPHVFRLQQDVLDKGPVDLLFIESAVNDYVNATPALTQQRALEGIIRHALTVNPYMNIIMMGFADEFKLADYAAGKIPAEIQLHERLARYYQLPFINLAKEVYERIQNKEFSWEGDFKNLHPAPFGQALYANAIETLLDKSFNKNETPAPAKTVLPKMLDTKSYVDGFYLPVEKAVLKKGFILNAAWTPKDGVSTRPGFVNRPVLEGVAPGAALELSFSGTAIGIAVVSGPDAGTIRYSIDGKEPGTIDLYTQWSSGLHLPWYVLLEDGLSKGPHRLSITIADEKNTRSKGNAVRIVHFLVSR